MKRMLMALAAVGGLTAAGGSVRADWGQTPAPPPNYGGGGAAMPAEFTTPGTLLGLGHAQSGKAPDRYGLLPSLRRTLKLDGGGCSTCGKGGSGFVGPHSGKGGGHLAGPGYGYAQYPPVMQGTLAFPNHPYVRSPRDFFMYEPAR